MSGETDAFAQLVARYQDRLFSSMIHQCRNRELAEDVVQQAFVLAFRKLDQYRGDGAFYSWLFRIAMNALITEKRRQKRRGGSVDAAREHTGSEPMDHRETSPARGIELEEEKRLLWQALNSVTDEFRTVLLLKEIDDLSYEEIAETVGIPIGTVRSRIHRGRSELREKLRILMSES